MAAREGNDPFASLNLPQGIRAQALKLLDNITQARTAADCTRAADRAEGFGLGIETVKALNAASIEGLYLAFENAAMARGIELEQ